jgi:zinc transport system substrate-binding protein
LKTCKVNFRQLLRVMFSYRRRAGVAFAMLLVVVICCQPAYSLAGSKPIEVFVSILPQKYFVKRVGGELVNVHVMVGPGRSPATYEPTPKQMAKLAQADIYFRIGTPFEDVWMRRIKATNPGLNVIDAREVVELREIEHKDFLYDSFAKRRKETRSHDHGLNDHGLKDPHIWTDPMIVKKFMGYFTSQLALLYPRHEKVFKANYQHFAADLDQLDQKIHAVFQDTISQDTLFQNKKSRRFLVFHPSWGYFADRYGLVQVPIELEGKTPNAKELAVVIDYAKKHNIKRVFVQQQFSQKNAQAVANAIGGTVISVDPLAEDYLNNLLLVAQRFSGSMQ